MRTVPAKAVTAALILSTAACQPNVEREPAAATPPSTQPGTTGTPAPIEPRSGENAPFAAIAADETIRLVGTEPFWGGTVTGGEMVYSTMENQDGDTIMVKRFAGNSGLGFSGTWNGAAIDLTVTPGSCSDGMSDRTFPFTATLRLGEEQRNGCAWTDRTPFTGPANP